jgi:hypothetical protein
VGPYTLFCRTSQWGYATPRPPPRSRSGPGLEYGYYSQEPQYHYHDNDHHSDGDQVVGAHWCAFLQIRPAPEGGLCPYATSRESNTRIRRIKTMTISIGMSPPRTFSPPSSVTLISSNERQREHNQKDHHQDDDQYRESPIYPPPPRSLSLDARSSSRNIYPLRPPLNRNGYTKKRRPFRDAACRSSSLELLTSCLPFRRRAWRALPPRARPRSRPWSR